jgi:hypothetical protein
MFMDPKRLPQDIRDDLALACDPNVSDEALAEKAFSEAASCAETYAGPYYAEFQKAASPLKRAANAAKRHKRQELCQALSEAVDILNHVPPFSGSPS